MTRIPALFHPAQTLDCGQAFRWRQRPEDPAKWEGAAFGQVLTIKEEAGELVLSCGPQELEQTWRRYFDLAEDYDAARRALAGVHPALGEAAARQVAGGLVDLERIDQEPAAFGREELQRIKGVGPKVAECALLYGFHKTECFPMDVWMKRAMAALLPGVRPEDLGRNAGLAQQYIFHYSRMHPELFQ